MKTLVLLCYQLIVWTVQFIRLVQHNCGFCIAEICHLILEYILNKCGHAIHHFNVHFLLYVFLLMTYYLFISYVFILYVLDYGNDVRQKANSSDFLI